MAKKFQKQLFELIDPAKIQSVNVLKENSAEQKYGEKGKHGAIEITVPDPAQNNFIKKPIN
jgi:hypothetical protein